jgi:hypothetical protein
MGKSVDFNTQETPQFSMFLDKEQDQRLEQTCEHGRLLSLGISEQDLANKDLRSRNQQKPPKTTYSQQRFSISNKFPIGNMPNIIFNKSKKRSVKPSL